MKYGIVLATMILLMGCSADQNAPDPMVLVQNERAFAADVADLGMRDGFLAHLADDGVLFIPEAVNGKQHYQSQQRRPGHLSWLPTYAEISSGGDMGWTTGPWEWRGDPESDLPQASGHYNTIWRLQTDSAWKCVFDMGVAHGAHQAPPPKATTRVLERFDAATEMTVDEARVDLVALENTFSAASAAQGLTAAYVAVMANDIRFYRQGDYPLQGLAEVTEALSGIDGVWTWRVNHADFSDNRDMAYTFGISKLEDAEGSQEFSYARFWRRGNNDEWELALDIHIPMRPESTPVDRESEG